MCFVFVSLLSIAHSIRIHLSKGRGLLTFSPRCKHSAVCLFIVTFSRRKKKMKKKMHTASTCKHVFLYHIRMYKYTVSCGVCIVLSVLYIFFFLLLLFGTGHYSRRSVFLRSSQVVVYRFYTSIQMISIVFFFSPARRKQKKNDDDDDVLLYLIHLAFSVTCIHIYIYIHV